jgi:hypothetical protein
MLPGTTHLPIMDFISGYPLTCIAQTRIVIISIGARASRMSLPQPTEVARNCFVTSSPKSASKGAKSVSNPFTRLEASKVELPLFDVDETIVG